MHTVQKIMMLISQKYYPFINVSDNYKKSKSVTIHNSDSGSLFRVIEDSLYSFQDQDKNCWVTIPENCIVNGQKIYPAVGDVLTCNDIPYSFTTKEVIVQMAIDYFEEFIDPHYGIRTVMHGMYFFENEDDKRDKYFVVFQEFKSRIHDKIEAFISCN